MVMLALTLRDTAKSLYRFSQTTDGQQKKNETHHFISGILKTGAIFATYASMYAAFYLVKRPLFQVVLGGLTFYVHPLAVIDAIGTASCISGMFKVVTALNMLEEKDRVVRKIVEQAKSQAKTEGYGFYNIPEQITFHTYGPPDTRKRVMKIAEDLKRKISDSDWSQLEAAVIKSDEPMGQGLTLLVLSGLSALGASWITHVPQIFWLDRQIESGSRWLASYVV